MKLSCPSCGALIPATDTNVDTGVAKCQACSEVINIFEALGLPNPAVAQTSSAPRQELIPRPSRMVVEDLGNAMWSVHWRWFEPSLFLLMFFCIAWDSFLVFWYTMAFTHNGPWIMIVFPMAHLAVGVGLT